MDNQPSPSVLVLTSTYPRWTGDTDPGFVHELCRRLARRGFTVDVLAPRAPGTPRKERLDGVTVYRYPYFWRRLEVLAYDGGILPKLKANPLLYLLLPFFIGGLYLATARRLRRGAYSAIHAHWIVPQALVAVAGRGSRPVPILTTSHGSDLLGLRSPPLRWLKTWALRRSERISVVSRHLRDIAVAEHEADPDRVSVLPMGVDLTGTFTATGDEIRLQDRLVYIGRLNDGKGVATLIDALGLVSKRMANTTLDIAGDGPSRRTLENQARSSGLSQAIRFRGAVSHDRVAGLLRTATVAIVPSLSEGLGLAAVEAMGCGCPVVASDLPGLREVIDDGRSGLLAKPGDAAELADRILAVLEDPDRASLLAGNARQSVLDRFDWEKVADDYAQLLRATMTVSREEPARPA